MAFDKAGYQPLNTPKLVSEGVWIVDGVIEVIGGQPLPVRMTIVRLNGGDLLLHSPTPYSPSVAAQIETLGPIRHLVAPSFGHWMHVQEWLNAFPAATTWAAPGLRERHAVKSSGLRLDHDLSDVAPPDWADQIAQDIVRSGPFAEVTFFHRPSRTLILTDLVQNLQADKLTAAEQRAAKLLGILQPGGKAPAYLRGLLRINRAEAADAALRLIALKPERVILSHGAWFEADGAAQLRDSLAWLLPVTDRELAGRTVVITGASSGIGRAAAVAFAAKGAQLALIARREEQLEAVRSACEVLGATAIAIPADVTDSEAIERAAQAAEAMFGRIDVWINNAGVGAVGAYPDTELAIHRRVIEVNLMGAMHGAAAAVPRFIAQGHGTLINNISLGAWTPTPFSVAYTASKFGLRGLTAGLRQDLSAYPDIHVCGVFPAIIDTPGFTHGANATGRALDPGPFLYRPEQVARAFVRLAQRPRAEVTVGWPAVASKIAYAVAPHLTERIVDLVLRGALSRAERGPSTDGAVLRPVAHGGGASGGWLARKRLPSAHTLSLGAALIAGIGLSLLGLAAVRRRRA